MASRKEEKEQRRTERLAREQQDQEQARRKRLYSIVVGGALAVAAIAAVALAVATGGGDGGHEAGHLTGSQTFEGGVDPPPQVITDLPEAARAAKCELKNPVIEGSEHIPADKEVEYKTNPPTSGNHDIEPAGDGAYDDPPTRSTMKNFVHTLEHSRVEYQYDPALSQRLTAQVGGLFNEDPYHIVLFPNSAMPYQVAATAWGHLIGCDKLTDKTFDAFRAFRDRYRDKGPETPL
jgi:hypothetical protein